MGVHPIHDTEEQKHTMKKWPLLLVAVGVVLLFAPALVDASSPRPVHVPTITANCQGLTVTLTDYERTQDPTPNVLYITMDTVPYGAPIHFGTSYAHTFPWNPAFDHTWAVQIDAVGTAYDKTFLGAVSDCAEASTTSSTTATTSASTTTAAPVETSTTVPEPRPSVPPCGFMETGDCTHHPVPTEPGVTFVSVAPPLPTTLPPTVSMTLPVTEPPTTATPLLPQTGYDETPVMVAIGILFVLVGGMAIWLVRSPRR